MKTIAYYRPRPFFRPLLLASFCVFFSVWAGQAKADITNKGTEFWLTFPKGNGGGGGDPVTLQLLITSAAGATGQVLIPGLSFTASFTVAAGATTQVLIPAGAQATLSDGISALGIHVIADNQISINGLNYVQFASDGYTGLPVEALGTDYMIVSYKNESYGSSQLAGSEFAVVGTQDCTHVTITPRITTGGHTANVPYTETLNQGDVYQYQDLVVGSGEDMTGTLIGSDKPVAVFGAHVCDFVPDGVPSCNHLVEQLWPLPYWGTQFVTMPLATRSGGDTFRFVSSSAATTVTVNGTNLTPLQKGWATDQNYSVPLYVTSNHPIYLIQLSDGGTQDHSGSSYDSDPTMISVPPVNEYDTAYSLSTPVTAFSGNYENITTQFPGSVIFDGFAISSASYASISTSGYWGVQISTTTGAHQLSSANPFGVIAYGYDNADAYGYPAGALFSHNTPVPTSTPGGSCTTPTNTPSNSPTDSMTPTPSRTATDSPSPTPTHSPSNTPTGTPTLSPSSTDSMTLTDTPSLSATDTPTPTLSNTPTLTPTTTPTSTPTLTPTETDTSTFTPTPTPSPTFTFTFTPTATGSSTLTPTPTPSWSPTFTSTLSPTFTLTSSLTPSFTPSSTMTFSISPISSPTATPGCEFHVWPLPFNPARAVGGVLKISCLPDGSAVEIYTLSGELTRQLAPINQMATWDGLNNQSAMVSSGVYFYVIQLGGQVLKEGKIIVLTGGS